MCCRYYYDDNVHMLVAGMVTGMDSLAEAPSAEVFGQAPGGRIQPKEFPDILSGDVHPSDLAWVIAGSPALTNAPGDSASGHSTSSALDGSAPPGKIAGSYAGKMKWGFSLPGSRQLLINARSETVFDKKSFADSIRRRRCVIPARHFYEWDRHKNRYTFTLEDQPCLFLAGIYDQFDGQRRFVILTVPANASMRPVHDRMPLILSSDQLSPWIREDAATRDILHSRMPELIRTAEYEQLSFL